MEPSFPNQNKLGLYQAEYKNEKTWETKYREDGNILRRQDRLIVIADANYTHADHAAKIIAKRVTKVPVLPAGKKFKRNGFDLHFTPGKTSIGGLKNYNALALTDLHETAHHLAQTMYEARDMEGALWISEFGGSAILTQAMQILADKNITLETHSVFLYRPRTQPNDTIRLAHKLRMDIDKKFITTGFFDPAAGLSILGTMHERIRAEKDAYDLLDAGKDIGAGFVRTCTLISIIVGLAALARTLAG